MAKGRRERDRPKAAPDALYNPNKRIRLSYDSESEVEEEVPVKGDAKTTAEDEKHEAEVTVNGGMEHEQDVAQQDEDVGESEQIPDEAREGAQDGVSEKQPKAAHPKSRNPRTGQWHALGSPSWQGEGDNEDGEADTDEAMEYLRAVRVERQGMPMVLSGPQQPRDTSYHYHVGHAEFENDHAFIGQPDPATALDEKDSNDAREAFTKALKKRFLSQRHQMHLPPSSEAVAALTDEQPIDYDREDKKAASHWIKVLPSVAPKSAQVRSMSEETVAGLLELIQEHHLKRQTQINKVTSAWIWSLLARLDEVGLMNNDQVYAVRALGKKAVLVLVSLRSSEAAQLLEDLVDAEGGAAGPQDATDAADSKQRKVDADVQKMGLQSHNVAEPRSQIAGRDNTLATLDAILVIVGDIFGQRDLLEFRQPWEAEKA